MVVNWALAKIINQIGSQIVLDVTISSLHTVSSHNTVIKIETIFVAMT